MYAGAHIRAAVYLHIAIKIGYTGGHTFQAHTRWLPGFVHALAIILDGNAQDRRLVAQLQNHFRSIGMLDTVLNQFLNYSVQRKLKCRVEPWYVAYRLKEDFSRNHFLNIGAKEVERFYQTFFPQHVGHKIVYRASEIFCSLVELL